MEKFGCDRLFEVTERIKELSKVPVKTASEDNELDLLYALKKELEDSQS